MFEFAVKKNAMWQRAVYLQTQVLRVAEKAISLKDGVCFEFATRGHQRHNFNE